MSKTNKPAPPHMHATPQGLVCERCGTVEPIQVPLSISLLRIKLNAFTVVHKWCERPFVDNGYVDMRPLDERNQGES